MVGTHVHLTPRIQGLLTMRTLRWHSNSIIENFDLKVCGMLFPSVKSNSPKPAAQLLRLPYSEATLHPLLFACILTLAPYTLAELEENVSEATSQLLLSCKVSRGGLTGTVRALKIS